VAAIAAASLVTTAAAALVPTAAPAMPFAALARAPIVYRHSRFVPATGDWEGTANGFPASFQLSYEPRNAGYGSRYTLYDFADVTLIEPETCPLSTSQYLEAEIGDHFPTPVFAGGSLHLRTDGIPGGLTGAHTALLSAQYNFPATTGTPACVGTLRWQMHPVHRRRVDDGTWELHFSDGSAESITVDGQGRLAKGITFPQSFANCSSSFGGVDLFIGPSGLASFPDPSLQVMLNFKATTASGKMNAPGVPGCQLGLSASLTKRAA